MKVTKKVISHLTKCYSLAPLHYQGKDHFLVAAEKVDRCILFDLDGNEEDTVWSEPGGVMTMVQVPGTDGQFLATHKFYSPNDSKEAKIIIATPKKKGDWEIRTLCDLPFVHRFDILEKNGVRFLIACALKSGHEYKEDWSQPGAVYGAVLPENLSGFDADHQLELTLLKSAMLKNHGYCQTTDDGSVCSIVSCDDGVYKFTPPETADGGWDIEKLLSQPSSDAVLIDFDGDGVKEIGMISPFHGDTISIWKKDETGTYKKVYQYEKEAPFAHSIYGGELCGKNRLVIGHRKGSRELLCFTYDPVTKSYDYEVFDHDTGSANVLHFVRDGKDVIVSTNREIDEVAMYEIEE